MLCPVVTSVLSWRVRYRGWSLEALDNTSRVYPLGHGARRVHFLRFYTRRSTCLQMPNRISSSQSWDSVIGADWLPLGSRSWANHPMKRHQRQSRIVSRAGTSPIWLYEVSNSIVCIGRGHFVAGSSPQLLARSCRGMNCGEAFRVLSSNWRRELSAPFDERARASAARPAGDRVEHLPSYVTVGWHTRVVVTDMVIPGGRARWRCRVACQCVGGARGRMCCRP